jgi:hypothetical protein
MLVRSIFESKVAKISLSKPLLPLAGGTSRTSTRQREIFATDIFEERLETLGPLAYLFTSVRGHIAAVVRVHAPPTNSPNEKGQREAFEIYALDGGW